MNTSFLYDEPGPDEIRRSRRIGIAAGIVCAILVVAVLLRLESHGQLDHKRWAILFDPETGVPQVLWQGYVATIKAAALAMVIALAVGLILAAGRLSTRRSVRLATGAVVEGFRGVPLLLLMLFAALGLPSLGMDLSLLQIVVLALVAYNSSVLCEIFRGGILAIDKGQTEAAEAMGLGRGVLLGRILLPQAIPNMLPVLVSQMVILLKDTSLGFIVGYAELLRQGRSLVEYYGSQYSMQLYVGVAVMYIATNFAISFLARLLTSRQGRGRRTKSAPGGDIPLTPTPVAGAAR
ncbi:amino acid ABC transporter permease [Nocardia mexicana]|uniref:Amino acid ABC transporter membrane protein 2 (PAAT family) n=1 Tax=Nocardia mexicana TaxID=279262 RepID=A0A370H8V5_9NOCA|nr:amino acid ABC transporter permease [Nocardia mexicana]RDI52670.1 amino acid ABC transporter membrane protein 2 (PAAT family) [Nocardia mexicana]